MKKNKLWSRWQYFYGLWKAKWIRKNYRTSEG
jgi:hypothetical protein